MMLSAVQPALSPHLAEAALQASKSSDGFSWGNQTPVAAKAVTI